MTLIRQDRPPLIWERWLTEAFQPPLVLSVMFIISPVAETGQIETIWFGLMAATLICLGPLAAVIALTKCGLLKDHHVSERRHRAPIMLATLAVAGATLWLLQELQSPQSLTILVLSVMTGMVCMAMVSPFWKISGHAATLAGSFIILLLMYGWAALPFAIIPITVSLSRVRLGDHTAAQVIVGSAAGIILIGGTYYLVETLLRH